VQLASVEQPFDPASWAPNAAIIQIILAIRAIFSYNMSQVYLISSQ
jgi:hypothetical protein